MANEIRTLPLAPEIRAGDDGKKKITGYAVKWRSLSQPIWGMYREQFERGAFTATLSARVSDIYADWQHDPKEILGRSPNTLTLREDDTGLWYEIDPPSWADKYVESIERGSSFVFVSQVDERDYTADPDYVIRTVRKADLIAVSPVTNPAYLTSTAGVRSEDPLVEIIRAERERRNKLTSAYLERSKAIRELSIIK
jgi:HK97 family phage prohead protease